MLETSWVDYFPAIGKLNSLQMVLLLLIELLRCFWGIATTVFRQLNKRLR